MVELSIAAKIIDGGEDRAEFCMANKNTADTYTPLQFVDIQPAAASAAPAAAPAAPAATPAAEGTPASAEEPSAPEELAAEPEAETAAEPEA